MGRLIPNEKTWIGFSDTAPVNLAQPTEAEIAAATNLTSYLVSLTASSQGNTVPTPALDSKFERSIGGTVQASFQADFYRDDETDTAWTTLPRGVEGVFYVSRFGGSGTAGIPEQADIVEVWPVEVTSRTPGALTSNTAQTFTLTCAVNIEPEEDAVVAASVPNPPVAAFTNTPTGLKVTFNASTSTAGGGSSITAYHWDFDEVGNYGTGVAPVHTYNSSGTYHVILTVTNNLGETDDATATVTVS